MVDRRKSVKVIIRPHITPERAARLVDIVANKLWPGAAGGAQWITKQKIGKQLIALACEVTQRGQAIELRIVRNDVSFKFEPIGIVQ